MSGDPGGNIVSYSDANGGSQTKRRLQLASETVYFDLSTQRRSTPQQPPASDSSLAPTIIPGNLVHNTSVNQSHAQTFITGNYENTPAQPNHQLTIRNQGQQSFHNRQQQNLNYSNNQVINSAPSNQQYPPNVSPAYPYQNRMVNQGAPSYQNQVPFPGIGIPMDPGPHPGPPPGPPLPPGYTGNYQNQMWAPQSQTPYPVGSNPIMPQGYTGQTGYGVANSTTPYSPPQSQYPIPSQPGFSQHHSQLGLNVQHSTPQINALIPLQPSEYTFEVPDAQTHGSSVYSVKVTQQPVIKLSYQQIATNNSMQQGNFPGNYQGQPNMYQSSMQPNNLQAQQLPTQPHGPLPVPLYASPVLAPANNAGHKTAQNMGYVPAPQNSPLPGNMYPMNPQFASSGAYTPPKSALSSASGFSPGSNEQFQQPPLGIAYNPFMVQNCNIPLPLSYHQKRQAVPNNLRTERIDSTGRTRKVTSVSKPSGPVRQESSKVAIRTNPAQGQPRNNERNVDGHSTSGINQHCGNAPSEGQPSAVQLSLSKLETTNSLTFEKESSQPAKEVEKSNDRSVAQYSAPKVTEDNSQTSMNVISQPAIEEKSYKTGVSKNSNVESIEDEQLEKQAADCEQDAPTQETVAEALIVESGRRTCEINDNSQAADQTTPAVTLTSQETDDQTKYAAVKKVEMSFSDICTEAVVFDSSSQSNAQKLNEPENKNALESTTSRENADVAATDSMNEKSLRGSMDETANDANKNEKNETDTASTQRSKKKSAKSKSSKSKTNKKLSQAGFVIEQPDFPKVISSLSIEKEATSNLKPTDILVEEKPSVKAKPKRKRNNRAAAATAANSSEKLHLAESVLSASLEVHTSSDMQPTCSLETEIPSFPVLATDFTWDFYKISDVDQASSSEEQPSPPSEIGTTIVCDGKSTSQTEDEDPSSSVLESSLITEMHTQDHVQPNDILEIELATTSGMKSEVIMKMQDERIKKPTSSLAADDRIEENFPVEMKHDPELSWESALALDTAELLKEIDEQAVNDDVYDCCQKLSKSQKKRQRKQQYKADNIHKEWEGSIFHVSNGVFWDELTKFHNSLFEIIVSSSKDELSGQQKDTSLSLKKKRKAPREKSMKERMLKEDYSYNKIIRVKNKKLKRATYKKSRRMLYFMTISRVRKIDTTCYHTGIKCVTYLYASAVTRRGPMALRIRNSDTGVFKSDIPTITKRILEFWMTQPMAKFDSPNDQKIFSEFLGARLKRFDETQDPTLRKKFDLFRAISIFFDPLLYEDIFWLRMQDLPQPEQDELETEYFLMFEQTIHKFATNQIPEMIPSIEQVIEETKTDLDEGYVKYFHGYIVRQYYTRWTYVSKTSLTPNEEEMRFFYGNRPARIEWFPENAREFLTTLWKAVRNMKKTPKTILYEKFYSLLLSINSTIIDVDTFNLKHVKNVFPGSIRDHDYIAKLWFGYMDPIRQKH